MGLFNKLFPKIKEIRSKTGKLHFQRWRLLSFPSFKIFLHKILESDQDEYAHTHPWHFVSLILKGEYREDVIYKNSSTAEYALPIMNYLSRLKFAVHHRLDGHKITLIKSPVYSLVFALGEPVEWGYLVNNIKYPNKDPRYTLINHEVYRKLKTYKMSFIDAAQLQINNGAEKLKKLMDEIDYHYNVLSIN